MTNANLDASTLTRYPQHIAIIMDGNGRYATNLGKSRIYGHQQGMHTAKRVVQYCLQYQIPYLTLFTFSSENWSRPEVEVKLLFRLFKKALLKELPGLREQGVKTHIIGRADRLPADLQRSIHDATHLPVAAVRLNLQVAFDYGGRWDIVQASQKLARQAQLGYLKPEEINEDLFSQMLTTAAMPDPDLFIRTGGECRLSNFLLYQMAYTECCFINCYWPEFSEAHFVDCLQTYAHRERRFGSITNIKDKHYA